MGLMRKAKKDHVSKKKGNRTKEKDDGMDKITNEITRS